MSDDGRESLVVIAMLGAPFSPWYAREPQGDPLRFAAFNVALYDQRDGGAWSLLETSRVDRRAESVRIGESWVAREGSRLTVGLDAPRAFGVGRSRIVGRVEAIAPRWLGEDRALDRHGTHVWRPLAPRVRVSVRIDAPRPRRWEGWGYVDTNHGREPLGRSLRRWTWSRAHLSGDRTVISYVAQGRDGATARVHETFGARDGASPLSLVPSPLPRTRWGVDREAFGDRAHAPRVVRTLEDTPFYARSLVETEIDGERAVAMHESLSLDRFDAPWVRFLLPFRIRREAAR